MKKNCSTCEHESLGGDQHPCRGCGCSGNDHDKWEPKATAPRRPCVTVDVSVNGEKVHEERIYGDTNSRAWALDSEPGAGVVHIPAGCSHLCTPTVEMALCTAAHYARLRSNTTRLEQVQARLADIRTSLAAAQSDSRTLIAFIDDTIKRAGGVT